jgi:23S rRNA (uracil1939-C5)-methyltransferase
MADELELKIEKLVYGGDALAHADGNTVFVPYALPGERIAASIRSKKKKLIRARLENVLEASPERQKPACPHFGVCGGCHYQHLSYPQQVKAKEEILRETLQRLGGIAWNAEIQTHTAEPYGYRNRAQWAVRASMPRAIGYFLPESSNIVPIDECPVLSPLLARTFSQVQELARSGLLPDDTLEIEAFADSADEKAALNVAFRKFHTSPSEIAKLFREAIPHLDSLLLLDQSKDRFELTGPGYLTHTAGGYSFRVSHLSFFQVNRFLIEELLQAVLADAEGTTALDLYAGVGFFTLPLARKFQRIVSVDANLAATRDLRQNAEAAGVQVTSLNEHVEEFLKKTTEKADLVVLDPPRSGLGAEASTKLLDLDTQEVRYLSCDPATLARDLAILTGTGGGRTAERRVRYEIQEIHLFDLFPQTFHIETLVRLRRAP